MKDNTDLVTYLLALRTAFHMHLVMPAVVPHSDSAPYMAMARFETGANGNPHYHGFSIGRRDPRRNRVRADVEGVGDEPFDVDAELRQVVDHVFGPDGARQEDISESLVIDRIRTRLPSVVPLVEAAVSTFSGSDCEAGTSRSSSESEEAPRGHRVNRREAALAKNAFEKIFAADYVEVLRHGSGEKGAIVGRMYRRATPVPEIAPEAAVNEPKRRGRYLKKQERIN